MPERGHNCPECGQYFAQLPKKCEHCGHQLLKFVDKGRLTDMIPGVRRVPYRVRKAVMIVVAICAFAYVIDLFDQLDKFHSFMNRRSRVPAWMRR